MSAPHLTPREAATWVAARLRAAGHRALFAGGCVRDLLLGREPADFDVATSATPEQIRAIFPRAIGVGESFGVMLVRHGGRSVETATFRADAEYADGRRPTGVRFTDDREDALRRDFTINGLFEDPQTGEVIDHVGGRADLAAGILRAIGDPEARLREDRLRSLRAVRFAARFGLRIDPATEAAVRRFGPELAGVSRERIGNEVRRMLVHPTRTRAVELADSLGLASPILNEPPVETELERLRGLPAEAPLEAALAAWMLGRAADGRTHRACPQEPPHAEDSRARCRRWRDALVLSNEESQGLEAALAVRTRVACEWADAPVARRKRLAAAEGFACARLLLAAEGWGHAAAMGAELEELARTGIQPPPLVTGDDLVAMGLAPGPAFRPLLDALYDRQLEGALADRESALAAARALAARPPTGGT
ncbi:MAG: CCA tRNA nucleotidyltransferase [Phycisphaerales bacterium]